MTTSTVENPSTVAVLVRFVSTFDLPTQVGQKGRPRARGRAYVFPEIPGTCLDVQATRKAVAAFYSLKPTDIAVYDRECRVGEVLAFIVPGVHKDAGEVFVGTVSSPA